MKLKIHYFRIFLLLLCFTFCNNAMAFYASKWVDVPTESKDIKKLSLDLESVNEHNNSLYYAIRYYKNEGGGLVAIVQSKGTKAGIVKTYSLFDYEEILTKEKNYPPLTPLVATQFNELTPSSLLYRANIGAMRLVGYNGDLKLGQADFTEYLNKLQKALKKSWQNSWYYSNVSNVGNGKVVLSLKIAYDGRLIKYNIDKSSGNKNFDNNIIKIVETAQTQMTAYDYKFETLPSGYKGNSVDIQVIFNYNTKQVTTSILTPNVYIKPIEQKNNTISDNAIVNSYLKDLQKRIKKNWKPPHNSTNKIVVISFEISKTGKLLSCNIKTSSGDEIFDNTGIKAIQGTKFKPLPSEYKKESVTINFTFHQKELFGS